MKQVNCNLSGFVTVGNLYYERYTMITPVKRDYGDHYYKYTCPVCNAFGNHHQVSRGEENCSQCGVNLSWSVFDDE